MHYGILSNISSFVKTKFANKNRKFIFLKCRGKLLTIFRYNFHSLLINAYHLTPLALTSFSQLTMFFLYSHLLFQVTPLRIYHDPRRRQRPWPVPRPLPPVLLLLLPGLHLLEAQGPLGVARGLRREAGECTGDISFDNNSSRARSDICTMQFKLVLTILCTEYMGIYSSNASTVQNITVPIH